MPVYLLFCKDYPSSSSGLAGSGLGVGGLAGWPSDDPSADASEPDGDFVHGPFDLFSICIGRRGFFLVLGKQRNSMLRKILFRRVAACLVGCVAAVPTSRDGTALNGL